MEIPRPRRLHRASSSSRTKSSWRSSSRTPWPNSASTSPGLALTPERARSLAQSDTPDLVLMDVNLQGGREGIEAARWMREVCGAEIVFVTAHTDRDTVARIEERVPGAQVLSKPVSQRRLADAVHAVM